MGIIGEKMLFPDHGGLGAYVGKPGEATCTCREESRQLYVATCEPSDHEPPAKNTRYTVCHHPCLY